MYTTSVRKVGGSVMISIPPLVLDPSGIVPGQKCGIELIDGKIVISPEPKLEYKIEDLMNESDFPRFEERGMDEEGFIYARPLKDV
ncbi:AbrB/MazE/SpoVT family DNA-binding domain-containing protein [Brucella thiophenivorans]|uniref:AbrB/MazE/SpoVT family DNA-binding domain-containing protein n=1 Tax=Brucella thiophenivorans TaxID=571255 RepID=UPI000B98BCB9|nr:hypothetical protein [Brucella thiophenivorans]